MEQAVKEFYSSEFGNKSEIVCTKLSPGITQVWTIDALKSSGQVFSSGSYAGLERAAWCFLVAAIAKWNRTYDCHTKNC